MHEDFENDLALLPEYRTRLSAAAARYAELRDQATAAVVRWDWYTGPILGLDPLEAALSDCWPRGVRLATEPGQREGRSQYGFDAAGCVRVENRYPERARANHDKAWDEEFRAVGPARIDGYFSQHRGGPACREIGSLLLENGRPHTFIGCTRKRFWVRKFVYEGNRIARVRQANHVDPDAPADDVLLTQYLLTAPQRGVSRVTVAPQWGPPERTHRYRWPKEKLTRRKRVRLDLRNDVAAVVAFLAKHLGRLPRSKRRAAGTPANPVSAIGLDFLWSGVGGSVEVFLSVDTRVPYQGDGSWTHDHFACLKRPRWSSFDTLREQEPGGILVDAQGVEHRANADTRPEEINGWLGGALVAALQSAKNRGALAALVLATPCELSVEESGAGFAWPVFAGRGVDNLV